MVNAHVCVILCMYAPAFDRDASTKADAQRRVLLECNCSQMKQNCAMVMVDAKLNADCLFTLVLMWCDVLEKYRFAC